MPADILHNLSIKDLFILLHINIKADPIVVKLKVIIPAIKDCIIGFNS